jgi:hypothetical protein
VFTMAIINLLKHVQTASGINTALGVWLVLSTWVLGYGPAAMGGIWNSVIVGALVAVFGISRVRSPTETPALSWMNAVMGAWMAAAPWTLNYSDNIPQRWNGLIVGILIFVLGLWSLSATAAYRRRSLA